MAGMIDRARFGDLYPTAEMREVWSLDRAMIPCWLDVGAALARAEALSEAVMLVLRRHIGRQQAHELVHELCMDAVEARRSLREVLHADPRVSAHLGPTERDTLLDPGRYTGLAGRFVDRVVRSASSATS